MSSLTLDDISDLRAYERERPEFRARVIALKKRRRVPVGPLLTLVFENRDTIRYQVQEMARAERMLSDEAIQTELDTYNPLIPEPLHLSATMFIELTSKEELEEWLPRLVGVETRVELRFGDDVVPCRVDPDHERQLTRETVTASVHYVSFAFSLEQAQRFGSQAVELVTTHPEYSYATVVSGETVAELVKDLRG